MSTRRLGDLSCLTLEYEEGSMYHDNPAINDTVLTVINDGNGEMCGSTYRERCDAAKRNDTHAFRFMARYYSRYRKCHFDARSLTASECTEAGNLLYDYYQRHILELAS